MGSVSLFSRLLCQNGAGGHFFWYVFAALSTLVGILLSKAIARAFPHARFVAPSITGFMLGCMLPLLLGSLLAIFVVGLGVKCSDPTAADRNIMIAFAFAAGMGVGFLRRERERPEE